MGFPAWRLWLVTAWLVSGGLPAAEPVSSLVVVRAGRLLDVRAGIVRTNQIVSIADGRIREIRAAAGAELAAGTQVIDLGDALLLPGLIDAHVHLAWQSAAGSAPAGPTALPGTDEARTTLQAGFTTVRNLGSTGRADVALRDAINEGRVPGPRMLAAVAGIGSPSGACDQVFGGEAVATPTTDLSVLVDRLVSQGADVIKVCAGGGVISSQPGSAELSAAQLRAIVGAAHRRGRKVAVHAQGPEAIANAVAAGVDSIEHGSFISPANAAAMKRRRIWLVPTLYRIDWALEQALASNGPPARVEALKKARLEAHAHVRRAIAAGVPIALGTDATVFPHGLNARELAVLVELGLSPLEAVRAATLDAARLLGMESEVGSLTPGLRADMVAVDGDPLRDVRALEKVRFVMKDGRVVKNDDVR